MLTFIVAIIYREIIGKNRVILFFLSITVLLIINLSFTIAIVLILVVVDSSVAAR
jgi:hypothetical protein